MNAGANKTEITENHKHEQGTATGAWGEVCDVLQEHFYQPDLEAAQALYASIAAHHLKGQPVWPMLVAPPGSMKTELVGALEGLPEVHAIDKVTANTFISGQITEPGAQVVAPSLLHRIGASGIVIYPDFSTVLAMKSEERAGVLADMRRIFDGHLRKEFGTSEAPREWAGRITFVVAVTPAIDKYFAVFQSLGERFVMVRWHRPDGIEAALKAMNQDIDAARAALKGAVHNLFASFKTESVTLSEGIQRQVAAMAEITVRARTSVPRSGNSKEVDYIPEPEAPTRLAQQLAQLAKGSARLLGRLEATQDDVRLVSRAAWDCIPVPRSAVLRAGAGESWFGNIELPKATESYAREDLRLLGLLDEKNDLSARAKELFRETCVPI